jgi:hypothetical protein
MSNTKKEVQDGRTRKGRKTREGTSTSTKARTKGRTRASREGTRARGAMGNTTKVAYILKEVLRNDNEME